MCSTIAEANRIERDLAPTGFRVFSMADLIANKPKDDGLPPWNGGAVAWDDLVTMEPQLKAMWEAIRLLRRPKRPASFCANHLWYDVFKPRLTQLVGWSCRRKNPALRSSEAWDTAYRKLYDVLPDCRDCGCF